MTVGGPEGKVYNTANKIVALSQLHPVALMVYDSASFEGIPWDTLIKEYRRNLGTQSQDTVEAYASDFLTYLQHITEDLPSDREPTEGSSGLVFAGFGDKQLFPALSHYTITGTSDNTLRYTFNGQVTIDWNNTAFVSAFAQADMVVSFIEGLHPDFHEVIDDWINATLTLLTRHMRRKLAQDEPAKEQGLPEHISPPPIEDLNEIKSELLEDFRYDVKERMRTRHYSRVLQMVQSLPKQELADMAEALVSLQSMKLRVTFANETVGGPVDVAVISKGDGLVWIKRKHYFVPSLNHRYFKRDRIVEQALD